MLENSRSFRTLRAITFARPRMQRVDDAAGVAGGALQAAPRRVRARVRAAQLAPQPAAARAARHAARAARAARHAALPRVARYRRAGRVR